MNEYYTDGHAVKLGNDIYCVATDVPAATEICNKLNFHAALLEAAERAKATFELFASKGGRLAEEAEIKVAYLSAAIAKAKAEQS